MHRVHQLCLKVRFHILHKVRSYAGILNIHTATYNYLQLHSVWAVCLALQLPAWSYILLPLCFSGIEEKSILLSVDQMESFFKPRNMLVTSELFCHGSETSTMLFTKLKEEPEEIPQLVATPEDAIIALDFGQNSTHRYLYPHNNFCLYSTLSFDSMPTPLLHAWTHHELISVFIIFYLRTTTYTYAVPVVMSFTMAAFVKLLACSLALQQGTHYIKIIRYLVSKENHALFSIPWAH